MKFPSQRSTPCLSRRLAKKTTTTTLTMPAPTITCFIVLAVAALLSSASASQPPSMDATHLTLVTASQSDTKAAVAPTSRAGADDDAEADDERRRRTTTTPAPEVPGLAASSLHLQDIEEMILQYIDATLSRRTLQLLSGLALVEKNRTMVPDDLANAGRSARQNDVRDEASTSTFDVKLIRRLKRFADTHVLNLSVPRAVQATAKTFFFKSLKKVMWPMFIGLQVVKTMLLAMFLPSIIGSLGKMVGKGLSSVSSFGGAPVDTVENLEFKDNYNVNIDAEDTGYMYQTPQNGADSVANPSFAVNMYEAANANNALSRFGIGGNRVTYVNSAADFAPSAQPQRAGSASAFGQKTDFKDFHDIPASSMLLTNYDPFYSPLLSRLDAVFQQMSLPAGNERCREKLVCLMYASPAKYAPYSNLVSAQLSRELNELKKPTTDNPDILRFFKYMRAAKDGQDQVNCGQTFAECTLLKDTDSPAMLTTYNDINKLVQARQL